MWELINHLEKRSSACTWRRYQNGASLFWYHFFRSPWETDYSAGDQHLYHSYWRWTQTSNRGQNQGLLKSWRQGSSNNLLCLRHNFQDNFSDFAFPVIRSKFFQLILIIIRVGSKNLSPSQPHQKLYAALWSWLAKSHVSQLLSKILAKWYDSQ